METRLDILYQDQHLVIVNKPARLLVGSDQSGDQTLLQMVRQWNADRQNEGKKGYCVPIHFLDRPVSGIVVFALSSKAAPRLNEMFKQRNLDKIYVAIVEGRPALSHGRLEHYLVKDKGSNLVRTCSAKHPEGKHSVLDYRVVATQGARTWIWVKPETGRSHQIRVQLASLGTPIVGDSKYGAKSSWDGRIALHAFRLQLLHPVGAQPLTIEAALPDYWNEVWSEPWPLALMREVYEK
ncbi:MAG: RluA family pseudouridine synthase [Proteobacteria bacterium]|nr:RluA family pseudouridine synthase [Pseudomonadota bacterium]